MGGWLEYDPEQEHYWLPDAHAPFLVEEEHPLYLGGWVEATVPLAEGARMLIDCFRHGEGLTAADHHPDLPHVLDRLDAPLLHNYLTLHWLPALLPEVEQRLAAGAAVADIGCGTGRALVEMADAYPHSSFTGYEANERAARRARQALIREGLDGQVSVVQAGTEGLAGCRYDFITVLNTVNEMVDPVGGVADIYQALTATGVCLFLERHHSNRLEEMPATPGRLLYALSTLYTLPLSLAHNGAGLGVCAGQEVLQEICQRAGFRDFTALNFRHPFVALYAAHK
jgi:SAM-dependent methyltransferase